MGIKKKLLFQNENCTSKRLVFECVRMFGIQAPAVHENLKSFVIQTEHL